MLRLFLCFTVFLMPVHVWAQSDGVEINLDALDNYSPPPMFESSPPPALPVPEVEKQKTYVAAPLPAKKPEYMPSREPDLEESQLVIQNAQDILRQIEGKDIEIKPVATKTVEKPPVAKLAPVKNKERTTLNQSGRFELALPYEPGQTDMSTEHEKLINREILLRLLKFENAALEVRAYTSSKQEQESPARRTSLERALAIKSFLTGKNIEPRRIYLRPLVVNPETPKEDAVELTISAR